MNQLNVITTSLLSFLTHNYCDMRKLFYNCFKEATHCLSKQACTILSGVSQSLQCDCMKKSKLNLYYLRLYVCSEHFGKWNSPNICAMNKLGQLSIWTVYPPWSFTSWSRGNSLLKVRASWFITGLCFRQSYFLRKIKSTWNTML